MGRRVGDISVGRVVSKWSVDDGFNKTQRLQPYSQIVGPYITLQTICSLAAVSVTGLPRIQSNGAGYQDVKEPGNIIAKNAMSVFMLNVLNYITVSRSVCKVDLR